MTTTRHAVTRLAINLLPAVVIAAIVAFAGPRKSDERVVHVLFPGSVRFFDVERKAMEEEAAKRGLVLVFENANWDAAAQLSQVAAAVEAGADLVALAAVDTTVAAGATDVIASSEGPDTPLVTFTNSVSAEPRGLVAGVTAHIGRDEQLAGRLLASQIKAITDGPATILSIEGAPGTEPQILRHRGLVEGLADVPSLQIADEISVDGWRLDLLEPALLTALAKETPDIVATQWADAAVLVSAYLRTHGLDGIRVVSLEWTQALVDEMGYGLIASSTRSSVADEGRTTIQTIDRILRGEPTPAFSDIDQVIVRSADRLTIPADW